MGAMEAIVRDAVSKCCCIEMASGQRLRRHQSLHEDYAASSQESLMAMLCAQALCLRNRHVRFRHALMISQMLCSRSSLIFSKVALPDSRGGERSSRQLLQVFMLTTAIPRASVSPFFHAMYSVHL